MIRALHIVCILTVLTLGVEPAAALGRSFEQDTLIDGDVESGGFAGPVLRVTEVRDQTGLLAGVRGGWVLDHAFVIGGGLYGLVNDLEVAVVPDTTRFLNLAYAGLDLEAMLVPGSLLHLSLHSLVGAGSVTYSEKRWDIDENEDRDNFFIAEPGASLTLNVHRNVRLDVGADYRYTYGIDLRGLGDDDLRGPSGWVALRFGRF
jgi:hypothetical protein